MTEWQVWTKSEGRFEVLGNYFEHVAAESLIRFHGDSDDVLAAFPIGEVVAIVRSDQ